MDMILYEKPMRIELVGYELVVNGKKNSRSVRTVSGMRETLSTQFPHDLENSDLYYMYRNVFKQNDIRFDITVIPPGNVGGEFPKTHGHRHPNSDDGIAYPEVYQILHGNAIFILQKNNRSKMIDVIVVEATAREVVLIPPEYGHVTINSGKEVLILSNLVYDKFDSNYNEYKKNKGAAYYYMQTGEVVQNTNYVIGKNEKIDPKKLNKEYCFESHDLLADFYENPQKFEFLVKPRMIFHEQS